MPRPPKYNPTHSFNDDQQRGREVSGTNLDRELSEASTSINETIDRLGQIQRDDGELANQSVGRDQLKPGILDDVATDAEARVQPLVQEARTSAQQAEADAQRALAAANEADRSRTQTLVDHEELGRLAREARHAADLAAEKAKQADYEADQAALSANYAGGKAAGIIHSLEEATKWAEYMAGPVVPWSTSVQGGVAPAVPPGLPPEAVPDGDGFYSSRWWAHRAQEMVGLWSVMYVGAFDRDPTTSTLKQGSVYYNTVTSQWKVFDGTQWRGVMQPQPGVVKTFLYITKTNGERTFGANPDERGQTPPAFQPEYNTVVHANGVRLVEDMDFRVNLAGELEFLLPGGLPKGSVIQWDYVMSPDNAVLGGVVTHKLVPLDALFNGVDTDFDLHHTDKVSGNAEKTPATDANELFLVLDGKILEPGKDYVMAGGNLQFMTAPPAMGEMWGIWFQPGGGAGGGVTPPAVPFNQWTDAYSHVPGQGLLWTDERGKYRVVDTIADRDALRDPQDIVEGSLCYVVATNHMYVYNKASAVAPQLGVWMEVLDTLPTDTDKLQKMIYQPEMPPHERIEWMDARTDMEVVDNQAGLLALPASHLAEGKLVFVRDERVLYEYVSNTASHSGTIADWIKMADRVHYVGRESNLPGASAVIEDGELYVVRMDYNGKDLYRVFSWDKSMPPRAVATPQQVRFIGTAQNNPPGTSSTAELEVQVPGVLNADVEWELTVETGTSTDVVTANTVAGASAPDIVSALNAAWAAVGSSVVTQVDGDKLRLIGAAGRAALPARVVRGLSFGGTFMAAGQASTFLANGSDGDYAVNVSGTTQTVAGLGDVPPDTAIIIESAASKLYHIADLATPIGTGPGTPVVGTHMAVLASTGTEITDWMAGLSGPVNAGDYALNNSPNAVTLPGLGSLPSQHAVIFEGTRFVIADTPTPVGVPVTPIHSLPPAMNAVADAQAYFAAAAPVLGEWVEFDFDDTLAGTVPELDGWAVTSGDWAIFDGAQWLRIPHEVSGTTGAAFSGNLNMIGPTPSVEDIFTSGPGRPGSPYPTSVGDYYAVAASADPIPAGLPFAGNLEGVDLSGGGVLTLLVDNPVIWGWLPGQDETTGANQTATAAIPGGSSWWRLDRSGEPVPPPSHLLPGAPVAPATAPEHADGVVAEIPNDEFTSVGAVVKTQGAPQTPPGGGWRELNRHIWNKELRTSPDQQTDQQEGDIQITREDRHEEIKSWNPTTKQWDIIYSRDEIDNAIASMSLFEGTVTPIGQTVPGSVDFTALPDLNLMNNAVDLSKTSHYWTYVGPSNYEVKGDAQGRLDPAWVDLAVRYDPKDHAAPGDLIDVIIDQPVTAPVDQSFRFEVDTSGNPKSGKASITVPFHAGESHDVMYQRLIDEWAARGNPANVRLSTYLGAGGEHRLVVVSDDPTLQTIDKVEVKSIAGTPIIGADLQGAVINPGDWVMVSNRGGDGTGTGANGGPPDLRWVTVGGDLLAKARADMLFGLQPWTATAWEKGALVVFDGSVYRAPRGMLPTDGSPAPTPTVIAGVQPDGAKTGDVDVAGTDSLSSVTVPLPVQGNWFESVSDGRFPLQVVGSTWNAFPGQDYFIGDRFLFLGDTDIDGVTKGGLTVSKGWVKYPAGTPLPTTPINDEFAKTSPWEEVPISGGLKVAATDADLPNSAPPGQVWIVVQSAQAGGQALFGYDGGASKWEQLGGGGVPMDLSGGEELISVGVPVGSVTAYAGSTVPNGWLLCDGSQFDETVYKELRAVLGTDRTPNLVDHFIKGAAAPDPAFTQHTDTTAAPKNAPFTGKTSEVGDHVHDAGRNIGWRTGVTGGPNQAVFADGGGASFDTGYGGKHEHTVTVDAGGDAETAPKHVLMAYIIKAVDRAVVERQP